MRFPFIGRRYGLLPVDKITKPDPAEYFRPKEPEHQGPRQPGAITDIVDGLIVLTGHHQQQKEEPHQMPPVLHSPIEAAIRTEQIQASDRLAGAAKQ